MATSSGPDPTGVHRDEREALPEDSAPAFRGKMLAGAGSLAATGFLVFALVNRLAGASVGIISTILLWCTLQMLWIFVRVLFGGRDYLRRAVGARTAACFAGLSAFIVGVWLGSTDGAWMALWVLPVYALVDNVVRRRMFPEDPRSRYVPIAIPLWVGAVTAGEVAGYAVAVLLRSLVR